MHTRRNAAKADGLARRRLLVGAGGLAWLGLSGCAALRAEPPPWEARLRGPAVVLLGETHDNAQLHRLRLATLRRALAALEMFVGVMYLATVVSRLIGLTLQRGEAGTK